MSNKEDLNVSRFLVLLGTLFLIMAAVVIIAVMV